MLSLRSSSLVAALVGCAVALSGCSSDTDGDAAPAAIQPPAPQPEPQPEPEPAPVQLSAELRLDQGEWVLSGDTNLPDGSMLDYLVGHLGSGCLNDACSEFEEWSEEEFDVFARQARGSVQVAGGEFSKVFDRWGELTGICNTNTMAVDEWETYIEVSFAVDEEAAGVSEFISAQPTEVYEVFGYAGERLRAAPEVERVELLSGFAALVEGRCVVP